VFLLFLWLIFFFLLFFLSSLTMTSRYTVVHNRLPRTSVVDASFRHPTTIGGELWDTQSSWMLFNNLFFVLRLYLVSLRWDITKMQRLMSMLLVRLMHRLVEHSERSLAYAIVRLSQGLIGEFTVYIDPLSVCISCIAFVFMFYVLLMGLIAWLK